MKLNDNLIIFPSEKDMAIAGINAIKKTLEGSSNTKISIGFSGGKTPILFFDLLAIDQEINWDRIDIFLVDERWDKSGKDTLKTLITKHLISKINIPSKNLHLVDYYDSLGITLDRYSKKVEKISQFDLLFLGVGSDGHTASIFEIDECDLSGSVIVNSSPRHPHIRISISMSTINKAKRKIVMGGPEKQKLLTENIDITLPISKVLNPEFYSFKK